MFHCVLSGLMRFFLVITMSLFSFLLSHSFQVDFSGFYMILDSSLEV